MPQLTVGYEWFKKILGTGIKNDLYFIKIPDLIDKIKNYEKIKTQYFATFSGNTIGANIPNLSNSLITNLSNSKIIKNIKTLIDGSFLSLCKNVNYPSEGYDVITNSYWTRKTLGKINLSPLSLSFFIDGEYKVYDIFNCIKNNVLLDKEHGVYNYPDNYTFKKITVATFNPSVFANLEGISFINTAIYIKNFYNCMIQNIGEVNKDVTSKDTLEEFTVNIEYEYAYPGELIDIAETELTKIAYNSKRLIGLIGSLT